MQYYRCKCGKTTAWTTIGVSPCVTCHRCGSDLAQGETLHREPAPHRYVTRYDPITGKPYELCDVCCERRESIEAPPKPEPPPPPPPDDYLSLFPIAHRYPHCDPYVLHVAGTCEFCDLPENAPLRLHREIHRINCTGENDPTKKPCPAEARRPKSLIDRWPGNRPSSTKDPA